jgi:hypothetical protein
MSLDTLFLIQRSLSSAQTFPIFGPLVVSPVKASISLVQTIVGLASIIFLGMGACILQSYPLTTMTLIAMGKTGLGIIGLIYALSNILTLGYIGYVCELHYQIAHPTVFEFA